jgi:hypothetical protein
MSEKGTNLTPYSAPSICIGDRLEWQQVQNLKWLSILPCPNGLFGPVVAASLEAFVKASRSVSDIKHKIVMNIM